MNKLSAQQALAGALSAEAVAESRKIYGGNVVTRKKSKGFFSRLLESFGDPLIKILMIALGINVVFLFKNAEWYETAIIAAAILIATVISTVSEMGSEAAFRRLQTDAMRVVCRIIRREGLIELPISDIVVGDIVQLQAGDRIPADGCLTEGQIDVNQSALNGESKEAKKYACSSGGGEYIQSADFSDKNALFSGTVVCSGQGIMRVTSVGDKTFYGRLAAELQEETGASPMKERLGDLAKSISRFGYAGAALVALAYLFNVFVVGNGFEAALIKAALSDWRELVPKLLYAVTLAVTVIVMAVPEGLPMMITVVLTSNMKRMMKDNVIVRKLVGIETAGSLNILFCDKTGTLTRGELDVNCFIDGDGREWRENDGVWTRAIWQYIYNSLCYNNSASLSGGVPIGGNSTDRTLLKYASAHSAGNSDFRYTNIIPFSSELKYMVSELKDGSGRTTLIKGAPEILLPNCRDYIAPDGEIRKLTDIKTLERRAQAMQKQGFRLIAAAISADKPTVSGGFGRLTLVGLVSLRDDVRPEAKEGVRQITGAGIQMVMITGDAKKTAEAIAGETGLLDCKNPIILTSDELKDMNDDEVRRLLPRLRVVARALPSDKSRLIRIAQNAGLVAGMTGDGVNDAPALKKADISFAMGGGSEVAKEASDIVIGDDNLLSIAKAVRYGRTTFKSIRKFIIFQLTLNFCAMGISMLAPLFGITSPITVIQILWINMVMDTLAGLAFAGEPPLKKYMNEPPKRRGEKIVNRYMWLEILLGGAFSIAVCMWFLKSPTVGRIFYYNRGTRFYTAFFALFMFTGIFNAFCARTHSVNLADHLAGNKPFLFIMGAITAVQLFILYYGGGIFRTNGLSLYELLLVTSLALGALVFNIIRKLCYKIFKLPDYGV